MANVDSNPLLRRELPIPFDRVEAAHVEPAVRALLDDARARRAALAHAELTWDAVPGTFDRLTEQLDHAIGVAAHLETVATTPEIRAAYAAIQPSVSEFHSSVWRDAGIFAALKAYAATDEARALGGARRRFLDKTLDDFKRSGADLDDAGKARLSAIDVELAQVTLLFSQNVLDDTNAFELYVGDRAALAGLTESAIEAARESAASKGKPGYRLSLQAPSYVPAMTHLDDRALRERLYRAFNSRAASGPRDNHALVARILELRREKARLLGYAHFADLATADRMAKSGAEARAFVATLRARAEPFFRVENEALAAFRRELEGDAAPPLEAWDVAYYAEKLRRARYDFDEEELRPYFALDRVLEGAFDLAHALYGVTVAPWEGAPTWDPSVRAYALRERDGSISSRFYVDVFPRETKRDGAWMDGLVTSAGDAAPHCEALVGNFTPPLAGRPALLTHREVETTFHEFGHLLHHASSRVPILSLAGTNVARDFVELPSQIMENWCWERASLDRFARHHETGAPIPDALFEKMKAARTFRAANAMMRQLAFAELDLALHMEWDGARDPTEMARDILERHSPTRLPVEHAMAASFGHLFGNPVG
ncbi:MAG TPA: M3 family metallopeptidase, partial [Byssovorax sp.]